MCWCLRLIVIALLFCGGSASAAKAQPAGPSQAQQVLESAADAQKYTFIVFYKDNGPATGAMAQAVKRAVEMRANRATLAFVNATDPAEKAIVKRFDVSRAPMPLTVAVAPNGAMTSLMPKKVSEDEIEKAFVSPVSAHCLKSMQDGRLVFVCVQSTPQPSTPQGVSAFCADPQFKDRAVVIPIHSGNLAEADFLRQLEAEDPMTVFLAPPGVLVGKFGPEATKAQLAAALHKAGKCCDDENCKHNQAGKHTGRPAAGASRQNAQGPGTRRK